MNQANSKLKVIIISASSGIGMALAKSWSLKGWKIHGTYRTDSPFIQEMRRDYNVCLTACDLSSLDSISTACHQLENECSEWDILVFASGVMDPIGPFEKISFEKWEEGIQLNFLKPLRILRQLLPCRNKKNLTRKPSILFFAGGGTNNSVVNYSSYTISKIALTKMCEFLDAEVNDSRFSIVGPGWVKTKIHNETLEAGIEMAGANFQRTQEKMNKNEWVPMEKVVECCTWIVTTPSDGVSGRNFSVAHDSFGSRALEEALESDGDMYKLRRNKNTWQNIQSI